MFTRVPVPRTRPLTTYGDFAKPGKPSSSAVPRVWPTISSRSKIAGTNFDRYLALGATWVDLEGQTRLLSLVGFDRGPWRKFFVGV